MDGMRSGSGQPGLRGESSRNLVPGTRFFIEYVHGLVLGTAALGKLPIVNRAMCLIPPAGVPTDRLRLTDIRVLGQSIFGVAAPPPIHPGNATVQNCSRLGWPPRFRTVTLLRNAVIEAKQIRTTLDS